MGLALTINLIALGLLTFLLITVSFNEAREEKTAQKEEFKKAA